MNASELFAEKIISKVNKILSCEDESIDCEYLITIIGNFILKNVNIIADCNLIKTLDIYLLSNIGELGKSLLLSSGDNSELLKINLNPYFPTIISMYKDKIEPLSRIVSKYANCSSHLEASYLTYSLIMTCAKTFLGLHGNNQFDKYFSDINSLSIDEAVTIYCQKCDNPVGLEAAFSYYLMYNNKFHNLNYLQVSPMIQSKIDIALKENEIEELEYSLLHDMDVSLRNKNIQDFSFEDYTIKHTDIMDGTQFESFISDLFTHLGYCCEFTKATGDQGIDIIARKDNSSIGIQTKCYSNTVGNKAVQEAVAGKSFYNLDRIMVVTNNYFTSSANELAQANNVLLWNRNDIENRLKQIKELKIL